LLLHIPTPDLDSVLRFFFFEKNYMTPGELMTIDMVWVLLNLLMLLRVMEDTIMMQKQIWSKMIKIPGQGLVWKVVIICAVVQGTAAGRSTYRCGSTWWRIAIGIGAESRRRWQRRDLAARRRGADFTARIFCGRERLLTTSGCRRAYRTRSASDACKLLYSS
jgi:hypothetical protein